MSDLLPAIALGDLPLSILQFEALAQRRAVPELSDAAIIRIARGRAVVSHIEINRIPAYGVTTGVGSQKNSAVDAGEMGRYNDSLITAHATNAPGPLAPTETVRAALCLQLHLFATGRSGLSWPLHCWPVCAPKTCRRPASAAPSARPTSSPWPSLACR